MGDSSLESQVELTDIFIDLTFSGEYGLQPELVSRARGYCVFGGIMAKLLCKFDDDFCFSE